MSESELLESDELLDEDTESSESFFLSYMILVIFSGITDTVLCTISSDSLSSFLSDIL